MKSILQSYPMNCPFKGGFQIGDTQDYW